MTTDVVEEQQAWTLTGNDRCDYSDCGAQAYVNVVGTDGNLLFCSHHYDRIVMDVVGNERLQKFAYQIVDERQRLIQNKSQGDDY